MPENTLIVPYLNQSPDFAFGVEYGMLYARMRAGSEDVIADYFTRGNQEDILLLANRLGWKVKELKRWGKDWFFCEMERAAPPERDAAG